MQHRTTARIEFDVFTGNLSNARRTNRREVVEQINLFNNAQFVAVVNVEGRRSVGYVFEATRFAAKGVAEQLGFDVAKVRYQGELVWVAVRSDAFYAPVGS